MSLSARNKWSLWTVALVFAVIVVSRVSRPDPNFLSWDVFGYYLYLPNTFIYHDPGMNDINRVQEQRIKYEASGTLYQAYIGPEGRWIIRYSMGNAVFYAPFFVAGHALAIITGAPRDGFSWPYRSAIQYGTLLYSLIALIFARRILLRIVDDRVTAWSIIFLVFGTNLYQMLAFNNGLTHGNLFMAYILIIWFTMRWHERPSAASATGMGAFCGLAVITRPTEILCVFIPLLWNTMDRQLFREKLASIRKHWHHLLLIAAVMLLAGLPQMLYWKMYAGKYFFRSYDNPAEGLDILTPYTWKFLFSFRKGWFVYTPLMTLAVAGFALVWMWKRAWFAPLFVFFVLNLWITSSWTNWWYAGSFGSRAIVQSYAVMMIPLAFVVCYAFYGKHAVPKRIVLSLLFLFLALNLFQTFQYQRGIIHPERMTAAYYLKVFGKLNYNGEYNHLLLPDRNIDASIPDTADFTETKVWQYTFEDPAELDEKKRDHITDTLAHTGRACYRIDTLQPFLDLKAFRYSDISDKDYVFVRITGWVYPIQPADGNPLSVVRTFAYKKQLYGYSAVVLSEERHGIRPGQWNFFTVDYMTPHLRTLRDDFTSHFWLQGRSPVFLDDISVGIWEPRR